LPPPPKRFRLFHPILAGATLKDRLIASGGAFGCLLIVAAICAHEPLVMAGLPALVAPIGASAVLLFVVPASPMAQPWSIIGGNVVSGLIGVAVAHVLGETALAAGIAVAAAILGMSLLRCLHPPGGAIALSAVVGGPAVLHASFGFPLGPVAVGSIILVILGWMFHRIAGHSYPHKPHVAGAPATDPHHLHRSDISQALEDVGEAFDVSAEDLEVLLERAEHYAVLRTQVGAKRA
jgi:CBS domain-containing membrane protein